MQTEYLIAVEELCINHNIDLSFISLLQKNGMIEIRNVQESEFIDAAQLRQLEKMIRLYYEMDINLEGIETITYLLQKIMSQQQEIITLKNRLRLYE